MIAYLIECGSQHIIYIKELQSFCIATKKALTLFNSEKPDFSQLNAKEKFQYDSNETFIDNTSDQPISHIINNTITEDQLLKHFYDPEFNPGAIIAVRDSTNTQPEIHDKYRYKTLLA